MLLYVHYPFCRSKCAYCAFSSQELDQDLEALYFSALLEEAEQWGRRLGRADVTSLYIGGGTPSLMRPDRLERLLERLDELFAFAGDLELTLEANPDSLQGPGQVRSLLAKGVNRISLGIQSLDEEQLRLLERPHTAGQAVAAVEAVRAAGLDNLGLDLLWGLPGQSCRDWLGQLERIVSLEPKHISCYCLTLEEGTRLQKRVERGELRIPGEEELEAMFLRGAELLGERGLSHYEIANFARPGAACRHNLGYWRGLDYLGLGPSAVSTIRGRRWANPSDPSRYAEAVRAGEPDRDAEIPTREQRIEELVMLGLRTAEGLDLERYRELSGEDLFLTREEVVRELREQGLVRIDGRRLWLTTRGMLLCDAITEYLLQERS